MIKTKGSSRWLIILKTKDKQISKRSNKSKKKSSGKKSKLYCKRINRSWMGLVKR